MTIKCIDISAWQGVIPSSVFHNNAESIPAVILRASYTTQRGFNLHKDKCFDKNIKNAYKANLAIGVYHYSQAISETEAVKEAEYIIGVIEPYKRKLTLPVAFDWEFGGRLNSYAAGRMGKQRCGQICDAFCRTVRAAGYDVMVYANLSTLNGYLPSDLYRRWKIWVAQYNRKLDYKHPCFMWQYTSCGKVAGIAGRVDMNWLYGAYPEPAPRSTYTGAFPVLPDRGWFTSGDKGQQVKRLQKFLNWYGGYGLAVDGEVGRKTINAVRSYQGREKLKVDGAFGAESLQRAKTVRR